MVMMRTPSSQCGVLIGLLLLGLMVGCNGEGIDGGFDNQLSSTERVTVGATDAVNRVLELMLGNGVDLTTETTTDATSQATPAATQGLLRVKPPHLLAQLGNVDMTLPCGTGSVTLSGTIDANPAGTSGTSDVSFTVSAMANFSQCDGMNGTLTLASDGTVGTHHIVYLMSLNGTLQAETCAITFDQVTMTIEANPSGLLTAPIIGNGSTHGACSEVTLTCRFNDLDIDDYEMFEASCTDT